MSRSTAYRVCCQFKRNQRLMEISLEQETLPSLLSNVWFQERSRVGF